ncbi:hypothetical protein HOV03_gp61 [Gordonia phage Asapag]|uniref:Uncharacterized protein n=1 Tax=Gordonia phage Asapag TaxID=2507862 RepID=A0A410TDV5_9CAUD|nr:hypothetical protein HOV03_gp61 [Gordonia phage Asapag]QAU07203.1 hypothetical protein SEA_ASAPAG_61 [Gordonia phage Asapag]
MTAADEAREWLKAAPSLSEGRRHVVALLGALERAEELANRWENSTKWDGSPATVDRHFGVEMRRTLAGGGL